MDSVAIGQSIFLNFSTRSKYTIFIACTQIDIPIYIFVVF